MEPSDGGWDGCPIDDALGSPTNRAITLANKVAEALEKTPHLKQKSVALYAYNQHSAAPTISVHPKIIISIATEFNEGRDIAKQIKGWKKQGTKNIGIREYYFGDRGKPGTSPLNDRANLAESISRFYELGARYMTGESAEHWGALGLGHWQVANLLWNAEQGNSSEKMEAMHDDFLEHAFPDVKTIMAEFYQIIEASNHPWMSTDLLGNMFRLLKHARDTTQSSSTQRRINDLILYTRYLELLRVYQFSKPPTRQNAFEQVIRFSYRIRDTKMVHSLGLYRSLATKDIVFPEGGRV